MMAKPEEKKYELALIDPNWIKRGSWDLSVDSLRQFFIVIGAGMSGEAEKVSEVDRKPVAKNMPDWLVVELVESMDSRGEGKVITSELRDRYKNLVLTPEPKKPQKRRVVLKDERKTGR